MPLFFLLSGFSLARSYGHRISAPEAKYQPNKFKLFSSEFWPFRQTSKEFSLLFFFQARLARVLPLYLLSNLLCLPLINWGFVADGNPLLAEGRLRLVLNLMSTLSLSNTWFLLLLGPPPSITSWTISTLAFFYLLFPNILYWAKTLSPSDRAWHMTNAFYIQLLVVLPIIVYLDFLAPAFIFNGGHISLAQWPTTTSPISRLPVFIIGVLAGLQRPQDPLPSSSFLLFPSYAPRKSESDIHAEENWWAQKIDTICCLILLGVIAGGISVLFFPANQFFNFYFQLLGVHLLLYIVLGLTKDGERSLLSRICCAPWAQWLGEHSLALYLTHEPVRQWLTLGLNWSQGWPQGNFAGIEGNTFDIWKMPPLVLPFLLTSSPLIACAIHHLVEIPAYNLLRPTNQDAVRGKGYEVSRGFHCARQ